jgi:acetoin utilization protein AcuC
MHDAAAHVVGATLRAAELVMSGAARAPSALPAGLHHARRAEAAGFCVYNDLAVAIRWLQRTHGARVMYIDIDAHHGDGVQWIFYDDPDVLTVSFHESGAFLFPGTGFIDEMGEGDGYGYSVNVPFDPHTDDASFLPPWPRAAAALAAAFGPDVIVLQAGCDAHLLDPLTHLRCTTRCTRARDAHRVRRRRRALRRPRHRDGRRRLRHPPVVPRAWALVWAALCGVEPPTRCPRMAGERVSLPSGAPVPTHAARRAGRVPAARRCRRRPR